MQSPQSIYRTTIVIILVLTGMIAELPQRVNGQETRDEILVSKNVSFSLELLSPLSTATNQKGDKFSCKVLSPVEYTGAIVGGYIRKAKRSGKAKGKSEMDLGFETISLMDGRTGTFNASVVEVFDVVDAGEQGRADNEGTVKAKSTVKRDMLKIGAGAIIGGIIGGLLGGGQGAVLGAAIGAGVGVTTTLATKGPDLQFKQGTQFTVLTNSPSRRKESVAIENPQIKEAPESTVTNSQPVAVEQPIAVSATASPPQVKSAPALPPLPPVKPVTPRTPSQRLRPYANGNLFNTSVPANWRESSSTNPVTFAPDGGYFIHQGQSLLTHGAMIGTTPAQSQDLRQASEQYISGMLQKNSYLHQQGDYQQGKMANHTALSVTLSGVSSVTGYTEAVTIYMTMLRNGSLFYVITVCPQGEYPIYQGAFQNILSSLKISEPN